MACHFCAFMAQLGANLALMLDHVGNTLLLGDPNETISSRTARARAAGQKWAVYACKALTVVFGGKGQDKDHCVWAVDAKMPSLARELWDWNTDRIEE